MAYLRSDMTIETAPVRPVSVASRQVNAVALEAFAEPLNRQPWMDEAACEGSGVNFFPARGVPTDPIKALCDACPVRGECLEFGLMEKFGIWGGTSERERRVIRRERGVQLGGLIRRPIRCAVCRDEFIPATNSAKLCSDICRASSERVRNAARNRRLRARRREAS